MKLYLEWYTGIEHVPDLVLSPQYLAALSYQEM
jgi:hypothetical protein